MSISKICLSGFRNITDISFSCDGCDFVVFEGMNAAGKTSILEALHLTLVGRSFRTREWQKLINHDSQSLICTTTMSDRNHTHIGVKRSRGEPPELSFNGESASVSSVAAKYPVQLFDSGLFAIFEGSPKRRRQLLDWALFHVKPQFYHHWQQYHRALKQKGALLKSQQISLDQLRSWNVLLAEHGTHLHNNRKEYSKSLADACEASALLGDVDLGFSYYSGWSGSESIDLAGALSASEDKDIQYKRCSQGPHNCDLRINTKTKRAGDTLSRGQKKLAGFAIKIEQIRMYNGQSSGRCILFCDDFSAELDSANQQAIIEQLAELEAQVFITTIEAQHVMSCMPNTKKAKLFHVKHGQLI